MGRRGVLGRGSVRIFEPRFSVRMVTNCALKCSYFTACLISLDTDRLNHYNHGLYPFEFLAADFRHRWPKHFISSDWPKPETTHVKSVASKALTKRAGQERRHDLVEELRHKILRDHMQFRIICSPVRGSFPVWGSFPVGDHLRHCTVTLFVKIYRQKPFCFPLAARRLIVLG